MLHVDDDHDFDDDDHDGLFAIVPVSFERVVVEPVGQPVPVVVPVPDPGVRPLGELRSDRGPVRRNDDDHDDHDHNDDDDDNDDLHNVDHDTMRRRLHVGVR